MVTIKIGVVADVHMDVQTPPNTGSQWSGGDGDGKRVLGLGYDITSFGRAVTTFTAESPDIHVNLGDAINGGDTEQKRNDNLAAFVTAAGGADGLDFYYSTGHWDWGETGIGTDDYAWFLAGMADVIPAAGAGEGQRDNAWWPAAAADDSIIAYTVDKNGFKLIFLTANLGAAGQSDDTGGGDNEVITQLGWLEVMLDDAQTNSEPVIIFSHYPFATGHPVGASAPIIAKILGYADGLTLIEGAGYTIPIMVVSGHIHDDDTIITVNGITHIGIKGDCWGTSTTDTGRYSHAILEVTAPTYTDSTGQRGLITLTGYGHQRSEDMSMALVSRWKLNEPAGTSGANSVVDTQGNHHATPVQATASVASPVGHGLVLDGTQYAGATGDEIVTGVPVSITFWVKTISTTQSTMFSMCANAKADRYLDVQLQTDGTFTIRKAWKNIGTAKLTAIAKVINDNKWHLIGAVFPDETLTYAYLDGVFVGQAPAAKAWDLTLDDWAIGRWEDTTTPAGEFTGSLADVRVYSGVLSANDVKELYREGTTGTRLRGSTKKQTTHSRTRGRYS